MGVRSIPRQRPGTGAGPEWAHFVPVRTANGVTLDFSDSKDFRPLHCAFLVNETEFDAALSRINSEGVKFYAEFDRTGPGEINRLYGGRGVYFGDPNLDSCRSILKVARLLDQTAGDAGPASS